jgi:catechol 2,3-dioxygenase-like lactoylglutathione lyase family enzyme
MASIRLDQLNLVVPDVPATRTFYGALGLEFGDGGEPETWGRHHVSAPHTDAVPLDIDLDSTAFATKWNEGWPGGAGVVLGFKVESREAVDRVVVELVEAGGTVQQGAYDAFWGARYAVVSDPNGIALGIMSDVDPQRRTPPPDPD